MLERTRDRLVVASSSLVGFALAYVLCQYAGWPRLLYDPVERSFRVAAPRSRELVVSYPGLVLWGVGGAAVAAALARLVAHRFGVTATTLLAAWALTAAALGILFALWSLWPF